MDAQKDLPAHPISSAGSTHPYSTLQCTWEDHLILGHLPGLVPKEMTFQSCKGRRQESSNKSTPFSSCGSLISLHYPLDPIHKSRLIRSNPIQFHPTNRIFIIPPLLSSSVRDRKSMGHTSITFGQHLGELSSKVISEATMLLVEGSSYIMSAAKGGRGSESFFAAFSQK